MFWDNLIKYFKKNQELVQVYCQSCGSEITQQGGDVSNTGRIYCHGFNQSWSYDRCLDDEFEIQLRKKRISIEDIKPVVFNFRNAKEVQRDIRAGKLREFESLENSVAD